MVQILSDSSIVLVVSECTSKIPVSQINNLFIVLKVGYLIYKHKMLVPIAQWLGTYVGSCMFGFHSNQTGGNRREELM